MMSSAVEGAADAPPSTERLDEISASADIFDVAETEDKEAAAAVVGVERGVGNKWDTCEEEETVRESSAVHLSHHHITITDLITGQEEEEDDRRGNHGKVSYSSGEEEEEEEEQYESYGDAGEEETDSVPSSGGGAVHTTGLLPGTVPHTEDHIINYSPSHRRLTSNALATHLYHNGPNNHNHSGRASPGSAPGGDDMFAEEIAEDVYDLNSKVIQLQEQVAMLAQTQLSNNDKQVKLKQDNAALTERVHMLEEQVRDGEIRADKRVDDEQRRAQELLARLDKDKSLEIESLHYQVRDIENEYRGYREEVLTLRQQCERVKQDKSAVSSELCDAQCRIRHLDQDNQTLQERCRTLQHDLDVTNRTHGELLDELSKELEELKHYKAENESAARSRAPSLLEYPGRLRDMEAQVQELRKENQSLREQHDEMQAQMINYSIQEGTKLLHSSALSGLGGGMVSLADELNDMSRDDVMQKMREQQEINKQLKKYIDDMLINIIDSNPGILEIKDKSAAASS